MPKVSYSEEDRERIRQELLTTALNLMGKEVGPLRAPLCTLEAANEEKLRKALVNSGIAVK